MLINLRNALMSGKRLPYDAEVEYLESSGTQYIDTGYNFSGPCSMYLSASFLPEANERDLFGAYAVGGNNMVCGCYARFIFGYNNPGVRIDSATFAASEADFDIEYSFLGSQGSGGSRNLVVNGTTYTGAGVYYNNLSVTLFRANPNYTSKFKCRAFKIRDAQGNLVRDYIPVRKGTVGYLYDRVSGNLFGNQGTGDFVVGQDVVPVEYIESHGTEYIDLGTIVSPDVDFEFTGSIVSDITNGCIFGETYDYGWSANNPGYSLVTASNGRVYLRYGNSTGTSIGVTSIGLGNTFTASLSGTSFQVNGQSVATVARISSFAKTVSSMGVFKRNTAINTAATYSAVRINNLKFGNLFGFLPVRVGTDATSWEGAMMDVLTRRVYRNAGTGAFTYGNDLKYPIPAE